MILSLRRTKVARGPLQWSSLLLVFCASVGLAFVPIEKSIRTPLHQRPFVPSTIPYAAASKKSSIIDSDNYQVTAQQGNLRIRNSSPIAEVSKTWTRTISGYRTTSYDSAAIALKPLRFDLVPARVVEAISVVKQILCEIWWLSPILLCLVPVFSQLCFSTLPATPDVWKLVNLPALRHNNAFFVAGFLTSNISYVASAATLVWSGRLTPTASWVWSHRFSPAAWILAAGLVSSAFHSVQSFGTYSVAEAWCYLDHGVAITAMLYFWRTFGLPSSKVFWGTAIAGLLALIAPTADNGKVYTVLHSTWHVLSATAAALWALDRRPGSATSA
jgi:hypothetical protein